MSKPDNHIPNAKSIRHQEILEAAAEQPDASYEELADDIPSATGDLVENVLDEYGDPADDTDDTSPPEPMSDAIAPGSVPPLEELSEIELETLRLIQDRPDATQQELADELGLTPAAICSRVNSIPGLDWAHRKEFTARLFDHSPADTPTPEPTPDTDTDTDSDTINTQATTTDENPAPTPPDEESTTPSWEPAPETEPMPTPSPPDNDTTAPEESPSIDELAARIETIETQLDTIQATKSHAPLSDPELAHKVFHACLESDAISTDEELTLLRALLE